MKKDNVERDILWIFISAIIGTIFICCVFNYFDKKTLENIETVRVTGVVVSKQSEQVSTNRFGDFDTNYYVLFKSGELTEVELKEYMEINVGDTLEWYETKEK